MTHKRCQLGKDKSVTVLVIYGGLYIGSWMGSRVTAPRIQAWCQRREVPFCFIEATTILNEKTIVNYRINGWNSTKPCSNIQIWVTNYISCYTATLCLLSGLIQHFEPKSLPPYLPYLPHVHSRRQCIVYLVCNINANQLLFSWAYQLNSHLYTTTYIKIEN